MFFITQPNEDGEARGRGYDDEIMTMTMTKKCGKLRISLKTVYVKVHWYL